MKKKNAALAIALEMRASVVQDLEREIQDLHRQKTKLEALRDESVAMRFWPFYDTDKSQWRVQGGVLEYVAAEAAQRFADLTGETVSYLFNGRSEVRLPSSVKK